MYIKAFQSMLDSSIWSEPSDVRVVWVTMLLMANPDGMVLASAPGIAARAHVTLDVTLQALQAFQEPDPHSRTMDFEGRRVERVDGGWLLLNYQKYRSMRDSEAARTQTRLRVAAWRARNAEESEVTHGNAAVTHGNGKKKKKKKEKEKEKEKKIETNTCANFAAFWKLYPKRKAKGAALKAWNKLNPDEALVSTMLKAVSKQLVWPEWLKDGGQYIPLPATWLNQGRWEDEPSRGRPPLNPASVEGRSDCLDGVPGWGPDDEP